MVLVSVRLTGNAGVIISPGLTALRGRRLRLHLQMDAVFGMDRPTTHQHPWAIVLDHGLPSVVITASGEHCEGFLETPRPWTMVLSHAEVPLKG